MAADFVSTNTSNLNTHLHAYLSPLQFGFLGNLVKVFPSLATRPLYLVGESYAGVYIVSDIP